MWRPMRSLVRSLPDRTHGFDVHRPFCFEAVQPAKGVHLCGLQDL